MKRLFKIKSFIGPGLMFLLAGMLIMFPALSYSESEKPLGKQSAEVDESDALPEIKLAKPVTYAYVEGGHDEQVLDYYRYEGAGPELHPVLIWFHGGGWVKGSKEWIDPIAFEIASAGGYDLISANYRLADDEAAPWPVVIHDVKAVVRWVKINGKKLRINPKRIIVGGESAGAHLAAMVAVSAGVPELEGYDNTGPSSTVAAAVLFYGPYNMATLAKRKQKAIERGKCRKPSYSSPILYLLDCPDVDQTTYNIAGCKKEDVKQANPATYLNSSDPPVFLAHGKADCIVPWQQAEELAEALTEAGVEHKFVPSENGEHRVWTLDVTAGDIVEFLDEHVAK